jgi:predicted metalloendopeptidase
MTAAQVNAYTTRSSTAWCSPPASSSRRSTVFAAAVPRSTRRHRRRQGPRATHGFDDQARSTTPPATSPTGGSPTPSSSSGSTRCVIDQYTGYEVTGGTKLNGANTVGENIADIGGIKLSFAAYRQLRSAAPDAVVADGFTEDQQFFLGFGQAWCAKTRPDYERLLAMTDVHAPPRWRVNGALSATPDFGRAFRCKTGSKMVPTRQCVVW